MRRAPATTRHQGRLRAALLVGAIALLAATAPAVARTIVGSKASERITGTPWPDRIHAGPGNDRVVSTDGRRDVVNCGRGHDVLWADPVDLSISCERRYRRAPRLLPPPPWAKPPAPQEQDLPKVEHPGVPGDVPPTPPGTPLPEPDPGIPTPDPVPPDVPGPEPEPLPSPGPVTYGYDPFTFGTPQNVGAPWSLTVVDGWGRFEVRDGDDPLLGGIAFGERSEVTGPGFGQGDERCFAQSIRFAADFPSLALWQVVSQFHAAGDGSPPIEWKVWEDELYLQVNDSAAGTGPIVWRTPLRRGGQHDLAYCIRFSTGDGWVTVDGVRVFSGATMRDGSDYFKQGLYRDGSAVATGVVLHSGLSFVSGP